MSKASVGNIKIMIQTFFLANWKPSEADYMRLIGAIMTELEPENDGWKVMALGESPVKINIRRKHR